MFRGREWARQEAPAGGVGGGRATWMKVFCTEKPRWPSASAASARRSEASSRAPSPAAVGPAAPSSGRLRPPGHLHRHGGSVRVSPPRALRRSRPWTPRSRRPRRRAPWTPRSRRPRRRAPWTGVPPRRERRRRRLAVPTCPATLARTAPCEWSWARACPRGAAPPLRRGRAPLPLPLRRAQRVPPGNGRSARSPPQGSGRRSAWSRARAC
mmetsp:Transcript_102956/g.320836  ORF Transcript_102956/g.320836 Transcript_102956/m.320836 type:complete len:211 (-) Transcript_102956:818-1450(-)